MHLLKMESTDKETIIQAINRYRLAYPNKLCKCEVLYKSTFYRILFVDTKFVGFTKTREGDKVTFSESYSMTVRQFKQYLENRID